MKKFCSILFLALPLLAVAQDDALTATTDTNGIFNWPPSIQATQLVGTISDTVLPANLVRETEFQTASNFLATNVFGPLLSASNALVLTQSTTSNFLATNFLSGLNTASNWLALNAYTNFTTNANAAAAALLAANTESNNLIFTNNLLLNFALNIGANDTNYANTSARTTPISRSPRAIHWPLMRRLLPII